MQFLPRRRRNPPAVIIISLIDVLLVVLIFLMVTTTFKKQPAVQLALPSSQQGQTGGGKDVPLIATITKAGTFYLGDLPVTEGKLQDKIAEAARQNPGINLAIRADTDAPFGQIVKVMDAAKAAGVKNISAFTKSGVKP